MTDEDEVERPNGVYSYAATTEGVTVRVEPSFWSERSQPERGAFFWAYQVRIENGRTAPVRLLSRYWRIADARGRVEEVSGDGVVGEQPVIQPGAFYEYMSGAPLSTPSGVMDGRYRMEEAGGAAFDVAIPAFSLDSPYERRVPN